MSTLTKTWSGDWEKRIAERVRGRGFDRLVDYLATRPGIPYVDVANELGADDVAGIQLVRAHLKEAHALGPAAFRAAAKDSLVRYLRSRLPEGWGIVPKDVEGDVAAEFLEASAIASWSNSVEEVQAESDLAERVLEELRRVAAAGWRPAGPNDETVSRAFDAAWPPT